MNAPRSIFLAAIRRIDHLPDIPVRIIEIMAHLTPGHPINQPADAPGALNTLEKVQAPHIKLVKERIPGSGDLFFLYQIPAVIYKQDLFLKLPCTGTVGVNGLFYPSAQRSASVRMRRYAVLGLQGNCRLHAAVKEQGGIERRLKKNPAYAWTGQQNASKQQGSFFFLFNCRKGLQLCHASAPSPPIPPKRTGQTRCSGDRLQEGEHKG